MVAVVLGWEIPHKDLLDETTHLAPNLFLLFEGIGSEYGTNKYYLHCCRNKWNRRIIYDDAPTQYGNTGDENATSNPPAGGSQGGEYAGGGGAGGGTRFFGTGNGGYGAGGGGNGGQNPYASSGLTADMDTWWYMADLEQSNYIDTL